MARSIDEINYGQLVDLGNLRQINNLELTVEIKWTKNDGTKATAVRTPNFPNYIAARMPADIFKRYVTEMMLACVRVQVGAETWPEGSDPTTITGAAVPDPIGGAAAAPK